MIFKFPGEKIVNGDLEIVEIEAESESDAILVYNKLFPQFNYNEHVARRIGNAKNLGRMGSV